MTDPYSAEALNEQREQHLHQLQGDESAASAPTDRTETSQHQTGNVLYAWQMRVENGWNIIGMTLPDGMTLPLVTTSLQVAWEAFEIAQAHANRDACQVRLATFSFDTVAAIVDPNE